MAPGAHAKRLDPAGSIGRWPPRTHVFSGFGRRQAAGALLSLVSAALRVEAPDAFVGDDGAQEVEPLLRQPGVRAGPRKELASRRRRQLLGGVRQAQGLGVDVLRAEGDRTIPLSLGGLRHFPEREYVWPHRPHFPLHHRAVAGPVELRDLRSHGDAEVGVLRVPIEVDVLVPVHEEGPADVPVHARPQPAVVDEEDLAVVEHAVQAREAAHFDPRDFHVQRFDALGHIRRRGLLADQVGEGVGNTELVVVLQPFEDPDPVDGAEERRKAHAEVGAVVLLVDFSLDGRAGLAARDERMGGLRHAGVHQQVGMHVEDLQAAGHVDHLGRAGPFVDAAQGLLHREDVQRNHVGEDVRRHLVDPRSAAVGLHVGLAEDLDPRAHVRLLVRGPRPQRISLAGAARLDLGLGARPVHVALLPLLGLGAVVARELQQHEEGHIPAARVVRQVLELGQNRLGQQTVALRFVSRAPAHQRHTQQQHGAHASRARPGLATHRLELDRVEQSTRPTPTLDSLPLAVWLRIWASNPPLDVGRAALFGPATRQQKDRWWGKKLIVCDQTSPCDL
eukprot:scaffold304_cov248-Pinguiococcus_pyrenoidosus.AAC.8